MEIGPINRVILPLATSVPAPSREDATTVRQIVSAVRGLNKSELMGQNRTLAFVRDPDTHTPVIQVVDRETGDVIDQIPAEAVLRMMAELESKTKSKGAG